jgi:PAS domain S-box-containing protein
MKRTNGRSGSDGTGKQLAVPVAADRSGHRLPDPPGDLDAPPVSKRRPSSGARAIEERDVLYRRIVETTHRGIWTVNAENRITFANRRIAEMLGYRVEELVGRSLIAFVAVADREQAAANIKLWRQGINDTHEIRYQRKDGSLLWALLTVSTFLDEAGRYQRAQADGGGAPAE